MSDVWSDFPTPLVDSTKGIWESMKAKKATEVEEKKAAEVLAKFGNSVVGKADQLPVPEIAVTNEIGNQVAIGNSKGPNREARREKLRQEKETIDGDHLTVPIVSKSPKSKKTKQTKAQLKKIEEEHKQKVAAEKKKQEEEKKRLEEERKQVAAIREKREKRKGKAA